MIFNKIRLLAFLPVLAAFGGCEETATVPNERENYEVLTDNNDSNRTASSEPGKVIVFFGNSLSAGYGVEAHESFPSLIQNRIDSLGYSYQVVNAGVSGETTATGKNRVNWVLKQQAVDIFILELGANDGLRGLPPEETKKNLISIIESVRAIHPQAEIILAGMMVPPSMGPDYSKAYSRIYPEIARETDVALIPFLLENVGGVPEMNQADRIHPNPAGNKIVAENVWAVLKPLLKNQG